MIKNPYNPALYKNNTLGNQAKWLTNTNIRLIQVPLFICDFVAVFTTYSDVLN